MVRRRLAALLSGLSGLIVAACVRANSQTKREGEYAGTFTTPPAVTPTPGATPTPRINYRDMTTRLLTPLGAMIVSARNQTPSGVQHFQRFESQAVPILAELQGLSTPQAITIRAAVSNIREAWPLRDVEALERERRRLLDVG